MECNDEKFKGWDRRGIYIYLIILWPQLKKIRQFSESKDMEMQLKSWYVEISRKEVGDNDD